MWTDEIVEEIHRIREEYAKSFNYDLEAIFADLRKKEAASGREVVNLSRKPGLTTRWSGRARNIGEDAKDASRRSILPLASRPAPIHEVHLVPIPDTDNPLVLRTDYTDDAAWEMLSEVVQAPVGEFRAYVTLVSNPSYRGLTVAQILELLPAAFRHNFVFVADETAIRDSEHPVLVIDLQDEPGRTFRVIPSEMWSVENNLSIANMDFQDFVDYVDLDGVFRGFQRGAG